MSSLEALTGTGVYAGQLGGVAAGPAPFVEATIATTPTGVDDEVMVLVGAEGSQLQAGPCRWEPRTGGQPWPKRDDPCLVVTGDKGHRAIVWWKPATPVALGIPRVIALPASPVDGQEIIYVANAAKGVLWHLKYNAGSASAYKWERVGGERLATYSAAAVGATTTAYVAAGLSLTNPLAGDYVVEFGGFCYGDNATVRSALMRAAATTPGGDTDSLQWSVTSTTGIGYAMRNAELLSLSASSTVSTYMRNSVAAVTSTWEQRLLTLTPRRVG
jgi:hypothetical protein